MAVSQDVLNMVKRSLDTTDTAIQPQDLEQMISMVTPKDVPMFSLLERTPVVATLHEWVESTLTTTFTDAVYADGNVPNANAETHTRKNNKVMSLGRIAKVSNLLKAIRTIGPSDAMALEVMEKMRDLMRAIEYYIFNGNISNTSPQEMNGLLNFAGLTTLANAASPTGIIESQLQALIAAQYAVGGQPDTIVAPPTVALAIANFQSGKVRFTYTDGEAMNVGPVGSARIGKYVNPFGGIMDVIPERADFLPSGTVLVLQRDEINLGTVLAPVIQMLPLANSTDSDARLLKAYLTLVVRNAVHHGRLTNVSN